ncbi:MAG: class I SAM-dependent methyltransferase [Polyangiaceae bacterium]
MHPALRSAALIFQARLRDEPVTPASFASALAEIPVADRDQWLDCLWDIDEIPADDPELPRGCVPYIPCDVATVLDAAQLVGLSGNDVFVDVGSGAGRAALLAHLTSGAACVGLDIQPSLVRTAQQRADKLKLSRVRFLQGDAAESIRSIAIGTVFFLYCPFNGDRLRRFLSGLEEVARRQPIRVCCVDMPALELAWLTRVPSSSLRIDVYRSSTVTAW